MIAFRRLPGVPGPPRPLLDVHLGSVTGMPQTCLLDTGAAGVRLSAALAIAAGVRVGFAPNAGDVVVGGVRSQVHRARQRLVVVQGGEVLAWETDVSFCHPWPHPFGLLGLAGFFDRFDVLLRARDERFELRVRT